MLTYLHIVHMLMRMKTLRTTVRVDAALLREAKVAAAARNTTLTQLIADGLRAVLSKPTARVATSFELPTFRGNGLQPGVDLDDSAGLLEKMEDERGPR